MTTKYERIPNFPAKWSTNDALREAGLTKVRAPWPGPFSSNPYFYLCRGGEKEAGPFNLQEINAYLGGYFSAKKDTTS